MEKHDGRCQVEFCQAVLRQWEQAWMAQDLEQVLALFAPQLEATWNGEPIAQDIRTLRGWLTANCAPAPEYQVTRELRAARGESYTVEWTDSWTDVAQGRVVEGRGTEVLTLQDRQIRSWHASWQGAWHSGTHTGQLHQPGRAQQSLPSQPAQGQTAEGVGAWDSVDEMSANSFPASDPPAGITPA